MVADKPETVMPAGKLKARILKVLDRVARTGRSVVITKRGKPVARLEPLEQPPGLEGSIVHQDDIVSPVSEKWEADE